MLAQWPMAGSPASEPSRFSGCELFTSAPTLFATSAMGLAVVQARHQLARLFRELGADLILAPVGFHVCLHLVERLLPRFDNVFHVEPGIPAALQRAALRFPRRRRI